VSIPQPLTATPSESRDRSGRLETVGALQILLGCFCGLGAIFVGALRLFPMGRAAQNWEPPIFVQMAAFYLGLAVAFIWLGKGMFSARRWAWTLTVVSSWIWLIFGVFGFINVEFIIGPRTWEYMAQQKGKMPAQFVESVRLFSGVFLAFLYLGLPGFFLMLSHHESVRATCIRRDPRVPWTDRCPMPVLAIVLFLAFSILPLRSLATLKFVVPCFGTFLSGGAGALATALIAIIVAALTWGLYRLRMAAWWGALLLGSASSLNTAITFQRADIAEMYKQQGFSASTLEMFHNKGLLELTRQWGLWTGLVGGVAWVVYLIAVRRYFLGNGVSTAEPARCDAASPS
jgi:hypothetical protein